MIRFAAVAVALAALTGCPVDPLEPEVYLGQLTTAPPTLTATVANPYDRPPSIEMSAGVGVGLSCSDFCPDLPPAPDCPGMTHSIDPPELGQIHPVELPGRDDVVLLIAGEPGSGSLTVKTRCAEKTYALRVLP